MYKIPVSLPVHSRTFGAKVVYLTTGSRRGSCGPSRQSSRIPNARSGPISTCGNCATLAHMTKVASRDLRNHTAEVLRQVSEGAHVTVTVNGTPVAEIIPVRAMRCASMSKRDLIVLLAHHQADPGLRDDLAALAGETTDDLDSIR